MTTPLPEPSDEAKESSRLLSRRIAAEIERAGGWLPFVRYMDLALHCPGLGYYGGGARKFGANDEGGDFVTAPELTPLFGQTLATQVAEIMMASSPTILEVGAGSGRLAADLLLELTDQDQLPERYLILELSGELRARQRETLAQAAPHLLERVVWLNDLPERFAGCVLANELLDAMPVHAVAWRAAGLMERGVERRGDGFGWAERPAAAALRAAARVRAGPPAADADRRRGVRGRRGAGGHASGRRVPPPAW